MRGGGKRLWLVRRVGTHALPGIHGRIGIGMSLVGVAFVEGSACGER